MYQTSDIEVNLNNILMPNTGKINEGIKFFKIFIKDISSLKHLKDLTNHTNVSFRHLGSILFEKSVELHFKNLNIDNIKELINLFIESHFKEETPVIRKRFISILNKLIFFLKNLQANPEVYENIVVYSLKYLNEKDYKLIFSNLINVKYNNNCFSTHQNFNSEFLIDNNEKNIQKGLELLNGLIENDIFSNNLGNIISIYLCLSSNQNFLNLIIRGLSLILISAGTMNMNNIMETLLVYFPKLLSTIKNINLIEENLQFLFESIIILSEMKDINIEIIKNLLKMVIEYIVVNPNSSFSTVVSGIDLILEICDIKKSIFMKDLNFLKSIMQILLKIGIENRSNDLEDIFMVDEIGIALERLSFLIPKKKLYPILNSFLKELENKNDKNCVLLTLEIYSSTAENYYEFYRNKTEFIIKDIFLKNLDNQDMKVKTYSLKAISKFSEFLQDETKDFYKLILPKLIEHINWEYSFELIEDTIFAIELLIEDLTYIELFPYLENLLKLLVNIIMLKNASHYTIKGCLNCIGNCISVSKENIKPYANDLFSLLKEILYNNNTNSFALKGNVISILGKLALSQFENNSESLHSNFSEINNVVINYMKNNNNDFSILEGTFVYWYNLVAIYKNKFSTIFPNECLNITLNMVKQEKILYVDDKKNGIDIENFSLNSEKEEDIRDFENYDFVNAKNASLKLIGLILVNDPLNYQFLIQDLAQYIDMNSNHLNDEVRYFGLLLSKQITYNIVLNNNGGRPVRPKTNNFNFLNIDTFKYTAPELNQEIDNFIKVNFVDKWVATIINEESKKNVEMFFELMDEAIEDMGLCFLKLSANSISLVLSHLFNFGLIFQSNMNEYEKNEDEDEIDNYIFRSVCNLLLTLMKAIRLEKNNYSEVIYKFLEELKTDIFNYVEKGSSMEFQEFIGLLTEFFKIDKICVKLFKNEVFELFKILENDNDTEVNRNISFCIGLMFELNYEEMQDKLNDSINILFNIEKKIKENVVVDNLVAALIRIYLANNNAFGVDKIFEYLIDHLKKNDPNENSLNNFNLFKGDPLEIFKVLDFFSYLILNNYNKILQVEANFELVIKVFIDSIYNYEKCDLKDNINSVKKMFEIIKNNQNFIQIYNNILNNFYSKNKDVINAILEKLIN